MKRSRTVRDTLDELFYHDSLLEEDEDNQVDFSHRIYDEDEENEHIGLFIGGDDDILPPSKVRRQTEESESFTTSSSIFLSEESEQQEGEEDQTSDESRNSLDAFSTEILKTSRTLASSIRRKTGVDDITSHFMHLFAGQSSLVVL